MRRTLAKDFLRKNPLASTAEVVSAIRCSERTVAQARKELRGQIPPSPYDYMSRNEITEQALAAEASVADATTPPVEAGGYEVSATKQMLQAAEEEAEHVGKFLDDMTPEEMKRVLTRLIRNPGMPPQIRIAAITAKQKLDYDTQDRHALGPGAPLSREAAIDRLASLMRACGPDLVHDAITAAFTKGAGRGSDTEAVDEGQPPPPLEAPPDETGDPA